MIVNVSYCTCTVCFSGGVYGRPGALRALQVEQGERRTTTGVQHGRENYQ